MSPSPISRRSFLKSASVASAVASFPSVLRSQPAGAAKSPSHRLNIALIGVGGRGRAAVTDLKNENYVAFCDVDEVRAAQTFKDYPDVPRFSDYRQMFDKMAGQIDAVTVSTPDHMHYPIALAAMQLGKHVFVEKPMSHTIWEAREMARVAKEKKIATQMGNQGHASEGVRLLKEWVDGGVLGEVREVQSWTNRPIGIWPQGNLKAPDHSKFIPVVPPTLNWDVWQGVAPEKAYDPVYLPFNWRGFWDYGTGALGDMGCHLLDGVHWALQLDAPTHIEAVSAFHNEITGPSSSMITFQFPARGLLAPLTLRWYDGGLIPPPPPEFDPEKKLPDNGTLVIGTKATVLANLYYQSVRIIPEPKMQELAPRLPAKTIPRVEGGNHFDEWVRACKGGTPAGSNFDIASRLTELCLLSNVAVRARRSLEWDASAMRVTNVPEASQYITKQYRPGFGV
ncbi:MAG: Gfo/Idh/MocA family protein [Opitutaceae bacterium]